MAESKLLIACREGDEVEVQKLLSQVEDPADVRRDWDRNKMTLLHFSCRHGWLDVTRKLVELYRCDPESGDWRYGITPLHEAFYEGHVDIVRYLVSERGCRTTYQFKCKEGSDSLLHKACRHGHVAMVEALTNGQPGTILLNYSNENGMTALHEACRGGYVEAVRHLASQPGCIISCQNEDGDTPLHEACRQGHLAMVRALAITHCLKAACDCKRASGDTPLHLACYKGYVDIVSYLVSEQGCNTACQNSSGDTPLHEAFRQENLLMVEILTRAEDCKAACSCKNKHRGDTPLHMACRDSQYVDIVRCLVNEQCCITACQDNVGDTPLHEALTQGHLAIVEMLARAEDCKAACSCKNKDGDTPLHMACRKGFLDIVSYLVSGQGCSTACQNNNGDTPLHEAFRQGHLAMVEVLTRAQDCKAACSCKNKDGDTPLHMACRTDYVDMVRYLVSEQGCNTTYQNNNGDTPLHEAFRQSNLTIAEMLTRAQDCKAACNCKNKNGDTPLHMACRKGHVDMVRYLVSEQGCITACQNNNGDTPLHEAFRQNNLTIAEAVTRAQDCKAACNCKNKDGDIPLHLACRNGHVDMVRYLVSEHGSNTTYRNNSGDTPLREAFRQRNLSMVEAITSGWDCQNKGGNTPLHEACLCSQVHVDIVRYLVTEQECSPTCQNWNGDTPLHGACHEGHVDIVKYLVTEQGCSAACQNRRGDTPLHEACRKNSTDIVQFLLSTGKVDPWCKNARNESPVELTDSYAISKLFAGLTENLVTAVKVFIFGNPAAGKSTLVKVIENRVTSRFRALAGQFRKVSGVELNTAGISTVTIQDSSRLGSVTIYDLAGRFEYYSSHDALVENLTSSSTAIFIAVVKISDSEADVIQTLQYWVSFIENCCSRVEATAHLMVVGSWKDKAKKAGENIDQKWSNIQEACISSTSSLHFVGFTALDCRKLASDGLDKICDMIGSSSAALRKSAAQKEIICPHLLHTFIRTKLSREVAYSVRELCTHIRAEDGAFLPTEPNLLAPLLNSLSDGGHLLYLHNKEDFEAGWLVINKQVVLSEINGTVFAPENFKQHHDIATSTGVVPKSKIAGVFAEKYNIDMILSVLTLFEFCRKIEDSFIPSLIASSDPSRDVARTVTTIEKPSENYYFFPALVRVEHPTDVWQGSGPGQYQCGWCLLCSKECQYLTPRFLHVLLLRLAFSFALASNRSQQDEASPVLRRRYAVWKNGIQWLDQDGVETIVEVSEQNKLLLLLMSCPEGEEMACVRLRSSLISKLLETKEELCPRISTTELLIDPSNLSSYPLPNSSELTLYRMDDQVVKAVQDHKQFAIDTTGRRRIKLVKALHFEPYHGMYTKLVNQLFDKESVKQEADDSFLHDLAANVYPNLMQHISMKIALEMFNIPDDRLFYNYCDQFPDERDNPIMRFFRLLLTWKNCDTGGGTYQSLRTTLDKYSIFCGRNPVSWSYKLNYRSQCFKLLL